MACVGLPRAGVGLPRFSLVPLLCADVGLLGDDKALPDADVALPVAAAEVCDDELAAAADDAETPAARVALTADSAGAGRPTAAETPVEPFCLPDAVVPGDGIAIAPAAVAWI